MIIIGYPAIGKSTLALKSNNIIDLESSLFRYNGQRPSNWCIYYCQLAEYLSQQGFNVFVSSHKEVRNRLKECCKEPIRCIVPSRDLKSDWIEKLKKRYEESKLQKDFNAWTNSEDSYDGNVEDMLNDKIESYVIDDINYNLEEIVDKIFSTIKNSQ